MGPVSAKVAIDVPREDVFELLMDLSARPSFTDHFMEGFHLLRIDAVGVGAGARFKLRDVGWIDSIIEKADNPHRLVERGMGGYLNRIPNVTEWLLSDAGPDGCEVQVTFWTEPESVIDRIKDRKASERRLGKGFRRALERLREVAESDTPPERITVAGADRLQL
jgi:uncharacterized protein YndB with AHSA1/START domain